MILVDFLRHRDFNEGVRQGGATQLTSFICTIQLWPRPDALSHKYCFLHFGISWGASPGSVEEKISVYKMVIFGFVSAIHIFPFPSKWRKAFPLLEYQMVLRRGWLTKAWQRHHQCRQCPLSSSLVIQIPVVTAMEKRAYDTASDVVEMYVQFASKIPTPRKLMYV